MIIKRKNIASGLKNGLYLFLSFFAVILICYFLFKTNGFYPFDSKSSLTMISIDCQSQYITYLNNFKSILEESKSFVYTLSKTFGGDYLSIYSYYLASPFTLITVLFPRELIPVALLFTTILKMAFASLNMALLFKYKEKKLSLTSLALAISYGLCSYCFVYLSNFMWIDGVMILPLVVLGLHILLESDKLKLYWIYPLTLAYALFTSWYIGAMIVMFICIYFLYLMIYKKVESRKRKILKFLLFSIIGGMISSCLWIPAFTNFSGTKVQTNISDFFFYYPSLFFKSFFASSYDGMTFISSYEGKATMFTSIPALILAIFYFSNRGISCRERLTYLGIVAIYFLAISITVVNDIFHFGSKPTWFPARYSFIISFIAILAAEKQIRDFNKQDVFSILIGSLLSIGLVCVLLFVPVSKKDSSKFKFTTFDLVIFVGTVVLLLIFWLFNFIAKSLKKNKSLTIINSTLSFTMAALIIYSNYIGENDILAKNVSSNLYQEYSTYCSDVDNISVVNKVKNLDSSLYRMEMSENREGAYNNIDNNPMFYSYNGLSHYSSSEKKEVEEYLKKVGYQYNGYFESFSRGSTTAMNSYLGVKYIIESKSKKINALHYPLAYTYVDKAGNEKLTDKDNSSSEAEFGIYQNNFALPLGYRVEKQSVTYINEGRTIDENNVDWFDDFEYQNEIYHNLNGSIKEDVFKKVDYTITSIKGLTVVSENKVTGETYYSGNTGASMTLSFSTSENVDDGLYFGLKDAVNNISVSYDRTFVGKNDYWNSGIFSLKNTSSDHTITLSLRRKVENILIQPEIYLEQYDVLNEYISKIKQQAALNLKEVNTLTTYSLVGTFNLIDDNSDFIFTLPYEKKMKIYVDGKKLVTSKKFNIFTGVSLDGIEKGEHTIKITFDEYGLKFGIVISAVGLISLVIIEIVYISRRKKRENLLLSGLL